MPRFYEYEGDLMGLATDQNHIVFRWIEKDCNIVFSVGRIGNGCSCHFAADKAGLRHLKQAVNEFVAFLFKKYKWCTMVLAKVNIDSVGRLIKKCDFKVVGTDKGVTAYARCRE